MAEYIDNRWEGVVDMADLARWRQARHPLPPVDLFAAVVPYRRRFLFGQNTQRIEECAEDGRAIVRAELSGPNPVPTRSTIDQHPRVVVAFCREGR